MKPEDFIYKNVASKLQEKYPKASKGNIATCAGKAKKHFKENSFKKNKVFDACYDVALKEIKFLNKVK